MQRADEAGEEPLGRADDRRRPGGREHLADRPDRAADVIPGMWLVEPAPVVAHEVAHAAAALVGGGVEEGQRAVEDRRPALVGVTALELQGHDRQPGDIVDAVAGLAIRDGAVRMLHDADVVDERADVVGTRVLEPQLDNGDRRPAGGERNGLAEHGCGRRSDGGPGEAGAEPPGLRPCGGERCGMLDELADGVGERLRVGERYDSPGPGRQDVLGVPVRGRDRGAAGGDREGERTRGDLLAAAVRRDEHIGGGEQVGQLVDREEPVVERDVIAQPEIDDEPLEQ